MDQTVFTTIRSFDNVEITGSCPLVICDIDETLITFANGKKKCHEIAQDFNLESNLNDFSYIYNLYKLTYPPIQTDPSGFARLVSRLAQANGKLIFLTARSESTSEKTRIHFKQVGLNYDSQPVHYTNNEITKGEYIHKNINLDGYDQVIFIDDYPSYIKSVMNYNPQIQCYLFDHQIH